MNKTIHIFALPLILVLTGCATTQFHFTSEPSGATVCLRKTPFGYPFWGRQEWVPKGATPCDVVYQVHGSPLVALVSLGTNQSRTVEMTPRIRRFNKTVGPYFAAYGLPTGFFAGVLGGSVVGGIAGGAVLTGCGLWLCDCSQYYPQTAIHVDFISPDPDPEPAELPLWRRVFFKLK